ncbi:fibronectin type III domain-containing protein [Pseudofulvibacter geojedonensis]|uniref:Fibronectin type III domain-containing protein n=1 Tax=Pseudofulvibacter geojedonensis TaxID=1123758 RepID=A0ABW3HZ28_9FLAO
MMRRIIYLFIMLLITSFWSVNAQSTINITTSGGSYHSEKWVNITTAINGAGTQVWGQGNGTICNGTGLINQDINLAPGNYYVNCYDAYDDSWDGTLITVTAYGNVIGNNGGVTPNDGTDTDVNGTCEGTTEELEASFMITVPAPPCLEPNNLTATNILPTSANLAWSAGGGETGWEIVLQAAGGTVPTESGAPINSNPYSAIGLTPETNYEFYVRANCGASGYTNWGGPHVFKTPCTVFTPTYTQDFAAFPVNCWEEGNDTDVATGPNYADGAWVTDGFLNVGSSGAARINLKDTGDSDWLISPIFDLSAGGYEIRFDIGITESFSGDASGMGSDDEVRVLYSIDNGATWNTLEFFYSGNTLSNLGVQKIYNLSAITSATTKFAFWATEGAVDDPEDYNVYIDNFIVQSIPCMSPSSVSGSNITATTADLSWISGGSGESEWDIILQEIGVSMVANEVVTSNSYNATGLTPGANYAFSVRAKCGANGVSYWHTYNFQTPCVTITPSYTNDFTPYPGNCWQEGNDTSIAAGPNNADGAWRSAPFLNTGAVNSALINLYNVGDSDWLVSPTFDLSAGGYELRYNIGVTGSTVMGSDDQVQVLISNDDGANWINLETFNAGNTPSNTGEVKVYNLAAYTSATTKFAFWATEGTVDDAEDCYIYINEFKIRTATTCGEPDILTATNITATTANLGWTSGGSSESQWEVVVQAQGSGVPTGAGTIVTANSYNATGLTDSTNYEFYVRANCGASGYSSWSGPFMFQTTCTAITPAYTNNFSVFPGACWEERYGELGGTTWPSNSSWLSSNYLYNAANGKSARINLYLNQARDWLVSPTFDLSAGNLAMSVKVGVTAYNSTNPGTMGSDDEVRILISNDNGATWETLERFNRANTPSNTGEEKVYDLSAYTSATTKFAFWGTEGTTNDVEDFDFYVEDFRVDTYAILDVEEVSLEKNFTYFPNPVENKLTVSAKNNIEALSVINMLGQTVRTVQPNLTAYELDFSDLNTGVYFVKVSINGTKETVRIIKK